MVTVRFGCSGRQGRDCRIVTAIAAQELFMTALTSDIAAFVATVDAGAMPERANFGARIGMLDCVGTMIAGADEEAVQLVARIVPTSTTNDGAPEIPNGRNLSAADAALVNGVAAHVLDYDDVGMDGHPSAALAPAILAEGWTLGSSGEEALAAYVAGYEVWALLQELEPGALHERGFHPTAIWGTLSAAAACARLNHLNAEETTNAIAIAASLAAGTVANFGTMTKSLHAGRTAQSGVLAARLAKSGFTASPDVLEHRAGFMHSHSESGNPAVTRGEWGLGSNWRPEKMGINIKRYPLCYATHRPPAAGRSGRPRQHPAQERPGNQARAGGAAEGPLAKTAHRDRTAREVPRLHRGTAGAKAGRGAVREAEQSGRRGVAARAAGGEDLA